MLFGRAAVVHGEGIHIQRHVPTGQHTEVNGLAGDLEAKHGGVDAVSQVKPGGGMRVHALAQGGRRGHSTQTQRTGEERVFALAFDGIEVVLAQAQQTEVAFEDVAVGNATAHREGRVDQAVDVDALQILANQCQTGLVAQVVGQLFENEIGHVGLHLLGEAHMRSKLLISMGNQWIFDEQLTDSGYCLLRRP